MERLPERASTHASIHCGDQAVAKAYVEEAIRVLSGVLVGVAALWSVRHVELPLSG
jgi:hypothetical protein